MKGTLGILGMITILAPLAAYADPQPTPLTGTVSGIVTAMPAKYLPETVVYLKAVSGSYPATTLNMDQIHMDFVPHILLITVGDTVQFTNHDSMAHNVFTTDGERYNLGMISSGGSASYAFSHEGMYAQLCQVHPEMLGYVFVGQNPYSAIVDATGHYTLTNVPPGTFQIAVWNSHLKAADNSVTVVAGANATVNFTVHR